MTLIGNNVINIFDKWWLFINMAGRNFKNSPPLSTFSLNKITMAHLEKIPLGRATLVNRWRLSALGHYLLFRWNLYYLEHFTVKFARKLLTDLLVGGNTFNQFSISF